MKMCRRKKKKSPTSMVEKWNKSKSQNGNMYIFICTFDDKKCEWNDNDFGNTMTLLFSFWLKKIWHYLII